MQEQFCLKNEQDIEDLLKGCAFYGTGGGGRSAPGGRRFWTVCQWDCP